MSFGEFFLTNPEGFPTETSGTPWGTEDVDLTLAGFLFRFNGLSSSQSIYVRERYAGFIAAGRQHHPPILTTLRRADPAIFRPFPTQGWTYTIDFDYQSHRVRLAGLNLMAIIHWREDLPTVLWSTVEEGEHFRLVFENVFRTLTAYAVLHRGGVLLHSAGISDGLQAWIGFGCSGAGKTTWARLSLESGRQVLSDDINVVQCGADRWYAQRLPFAGELGPAHGTQAAYPVAGLYHLQKSDAHRLLSMSGAERLAALLASAPFVNRDPYRLPRLTSNLLSLLDAVPCWRLNFLKDAAFWKLLETAVTPAPTPNITPTSGRCATRDFRMDPELTHD